MRKTTLGLSILTALMLGTQPALSQTESDDAREVYESTGALGGFVIGAAAGGPVGALVTTLGGQWLGNRLHEAKVSRSAQAELEVAQARLSKLQSEHEALQQRLIALNKELEKQNLIASTSAMEAQIADCCSDGKLTLHFRSNSSEIETHYQPLLEEFGKLAGSAPEARIEIVGYADRRGETAANLALSQRRVQAVEAALRGQGLGRSRFISKAFGEERPLSNEESLEANFFDRRVIVSLRAANGELLTQK